MWTADSICKGCEILDRMTRSKNIIFAALITAAFATQVGAEEKAPRFFGAPPGALVQARARLAANDLVLKPAFDKLLEEANKALSLQPPSVMDKPRAGASGDKHDYLSTAPYFWPDPSKKDGLPYIREDGKRNPESHNEYSDSPRLGRMAGSAKTLALAYYFTGKNEYAAASAKFLRVWFLDPATRMNPNFNQAQAIPGINTGRGTGMIESRSLTGVCDAAGLLEGSSHWSQADHDGLDSWMKQFLHWAQTSANGRDEQAAKNNHGTFYDVQIAHLALFVGNTNLARQTIETARHRRMDTQIESDGRQPFELTRADSFGYSRFNLQALFELATLGQHAGVDLWHYQNKNGAGIKTALDLLMPYTEQPDKPWPYGKTSNRSLATILGQAGVVYGDARYRVAWEKSPGWQSQREMLFFRLP
jgi:hypothetical protein